MTTIVYKSTDVGAPVLTGQPGSLIALLDTILVGTSGIAYGDKASLGWTKPFVGTNLAVFRNNPALPGSTGCYVRVYNPERFVHTYVYKTMTDVSTGTDPTPSPSGLTTNQANGYPCLVSNSAAAEPRLWTLIGDGRTFYLNYFTSASTYSESQSPDNCALIFGAGDYESYVPGNAFNYFNMIPGSPYSSGQYYNYYSNTQDGQFRRNPNDSYDPVEGFFSGRRADLAADVPDNWRIPTLGVGDYSSGSGLWNNPNPFTGLVSYHPSFMYTRHGLVGRLRGAYNMMVAAINTWNALVGPSAGDPFTTPLNQMLVWSAPNNRRHCLLINQENWD